MKRFRILMVAVLACLMPIAAGAAEVTFTQGRNVEFRNPVLKDGYLLFELKNVSGKDIFSTKVVCSFYSDDTPAGNEFVLESGFQSEKRIVSKIRVPDNMSYDKIECRGGKTLFE